MAKYNPPEQDKTLQVVDVIFILVAIFAALWLPLKLGLAGAAKAIDKIENPTWELLGQNATMASIWEKLGYTPETAHDIIQNRFHYNIDWISLIIMAVILIGYFVFLFRASDKEYREVIAEKFGDGK
jgi:cytochrome oxidase assembly protein ShyY1